jgi:dual specificity phosphatase 12
LFKPKEATEDIDFLEPMKLLQSPTAGAPREKSPDGQPSEDRTYKPIVLNNCDQIIPNLYLGGVDAVTDTQRVTSQGIKAICCCLREMEYPSSEFCKDVEYYRVDVEDMGREPIELYFPEATEFIHSWISREQPVLVHCRAGVSRSASVIIAYLMTYQGYSLHEAFFVARSHRAVVTPNIGFMEKLCDYEEEHRSCSPTIDMNKYESWYTSPERGAVPDLIPD